MEFSDLVQKAVRSDRARQGASLLECEHCGSTATPLWRSGPSGPKSLCNACGLRWAKGTLKIVSRSGVVVAPPKGRDSTAHTKTVRVPSSPKSGRVTQRNHVSTVPLPEPPSDVSLMAPPEPVAVVEAEQPNQSMPKPLAEMCSVETRPAALPMLHDWESASFFEDSRIADDEAEGMVVDLSLAEIMESGDISGLIDSMAMDYQYSPSVDQLISVF